MKYLKYVLLLLAVLVLLFFGKGLLTPSISYECEVTVDKPAAEAWAVMSDETSLPKWIDGFIRTEHVRGTPKTVGAVSHVYVDENGQETMMQETITDLVEHEHMGMAFTMDFMDMDYDMHFKEENGKTQIRTTSVTRGNGVFAKSIISFMPSAMKAQEEANLQNLKKLIDNNTKNYFPEAIQLDTE